MTEIQKSNNYDERSQINIVLDTLLAAEAQGVELDRAGLIKASGLTKGQVDDALSRLRARGAIDDKPKSYKVLPAFRPPRTPSFSFFPDGSCKFEIGDTCELLTPAETLQVAQGFAGKLAITLITTSLMPVAQEVRELGVDVNKLKDTVGRKR